MRFPGQIPNVSFNVSRYWFKILSTLLCHFIILAAHLSMAPNMAEAQRLDFGIFADSDIVVQPLMGNETLDFNTKQNPIIPGDMVSIELTENDESALAIFEITAARDFDIDVEVVPQNAGSLILVDDSSESIDFTLKWAFSNQASPNTSHAISVAQNNVVPQGISFATFPVLRRSIGSNGPPGPPPAPLDGDSPNRETAVVYLFVYGTINVDESAAVGLYSDTINIHVSYSGGDLP